MTLRDFLTQVKLQHTLYPDLLNYDLVMPDGLFIDEFGINPGEGLITLSDTPPAEDLEVFNYDDDD